MKVGILTYHRAENYGALLQAYALYTFLRNEGYDVEFVDYWPEYHVKHYRLFTLDGLSHGSLKNRVKYCLFNLFWYIPKYVRKRRLTDFMRDRLNLGNIIAYSSDDVTTSKYDVVIYGSDQIWRRQRIHKNEFNQWYFGSPNIVAKHKMTYAASMGVIHNSIEDDKLIQKWLENFERLSVRETDLKQYLQKLGFDSKLVIDPTFLLSMDEWRMLYKKKNQKRYILYYNLLHSEESTTFAKRLSSQKKMPVIEINMSLNINNIFSSRYVSCASVEHFLQLIDNAEYVVSNSFHGVAFSLIFRKQFWAVGMGEKANRVISLFEQAGLTERYIKADNKQVELDDVIDYDGVYKRLSPWIADSKSYLLEFLQRVNKK